MKVEIDSDVFSGLLCDLYDLRTKLPARVKAMHAAEKDTDYTIGDLLDDVIETMQSYETEEDSDAAGDAYLAEQFRRADSADESAY
jgi:hypothetical protein